MASDTSGSDEIHEESRATRTFRWIAVCGVVAYLLWLVGFALVQVPELFGELTLGANITLWSALLFGFAGFGLFVAHVSRLKLRTNPTPFPILDISGLLLLLGLFGGGMFSISILTKGTTLSTIETSLSTVNSTLSTQHTEVVGLLKEIRDAIRGQRQ